MHIDRRLLGWGVFFILVGAIPLAVRGGYLDAEQVSSWPSLWPVLLIGWGLGLLLRRTPVEWIGGAHRRGRARPHGRRRARVGLRGHPDGERLRRRRPGHGLRGPARARSRTGGQLNVEFNCGTLTIAAGRRHRLERRGHRRPRPGPAGRGERDPGVDRDARRRLLPGQRAEHVERRRPDAQRSSASASRSTPGEGTADLRGASVTSASLTVNAGSFRLDLANAARGRRRERDGERRRQRPSACRPAIGRRTSRSTPAASRSACRLTRRSASAGRRPRVERPRRRPG